MSGVSDMQVFWDAYGLDNPYSGVFIHGFSLADELRPLGIEPVLVGDPVVLDAFWPGFEGRDLPPVSGLLLSKIGWIIRSSWWFATHTPKNSPQAIVHGLSNWNIPLGKSRVYRKVLTIHDLIPLLAPECVSKAHYWQFRVLLPLAVRSADRVICVSEWTKRELLCRCPFATEKVTVIPNGFPRPDVEAIHRPRLADSSGVIRCLTVARHEGYKNLHLVPAILAASSESLRWTVVTDDNGVAFLNQMAPQYVANGTLAVLQGVSHEALMRLYVESDVYVHPSALEGFCLPAAEALAHGTPVVHMSGSGIDEVVGPVGESLEPTATADQWSTAIGLAVKESRRPEWVIRLDRWLEQHPSWTDAAIALSRVYDSLKV